MPERFRDWMRQAAADLTHARHSLDVGDHSWACFAAHQAAEKAIKAVFEKRHSQAWGHGVRSLIARLSEPVSPDLVEAARRLDRHYIPSRYPNGLPEGAPMDYYGAGDSDQAIRDAEAILQFCEGLLRDSR